MGNASAFAVLDGLKYLSLESFRKSGQGVPTPVWFAGDPSGGEPQTLFVYSSVDSGKAKRIRNNPRVRVAPCDMRGKLLGDWIEARAEIVTGAQAERAVRLLNQKYKPWKQLLDFFSKLGRNQHVLFAIRPA